MNDIDLSANTIIVVLVAYSIACGFVGAAFRIGIVERRDRKSKTTASKPKHTPTNIHA